MRAEADPPRRILDVSLTPMRRKHVRDVLSIERRVYPRPWSAALFFSEISQRKTRHYVVAIVHKEVGGYGGLMVHEDEGHITTLAVAPELQHAGIGTRLMLDLMEAARDRGARTVALEVRVANWPAQRLYSWFGFRPIGVRKNYYAETGEDALVMWVDDISGDDITGRLDRIRGSIDE
ncbi:MAG TPA: ribosomal protein S18-alanine N-acetyltransferase [Actinomycetota bacterium]|nr:ribosomal protein S18-alanine N-acetyltransferase [Actinomycetota bacterium]